MGIASAALGVGSAIMGNKSARDQAKAAKNASAQQAAAAAEASQYQKDMYGKAVDQLTPYADAGRTSLAQLMGQMAPDGYFNQTYSGQDIYNDPSYQFRLQQGQDAIESSAAARGGLLSGATMKALQGYGQDMASQEYQNAFNRYTTDQNNRFSRLSNLVGMGQESAGSIGNAGMETARIVGGYTTGAGDAQAAGTIGAANAKAEGRKAIMGGLGSIAGMFI